MTHATKGLGGDIEVLGLISRSEKMEGEKHNPVKGGKKGEGAGPAGGLLTNHFIDG